MRTYTWLIRLGLGLALLGALSACGSKEYPEELLRAKSALADSKSEGADEYCPDEYTSAEEMLIKAEALWEEGESEEMETAAASTISLSDAAAHCALAKKTAAASTGRAGELGEPLKSYSKSIYFDFNDNAIRPGMVGRLDEIAEFIKSYQDTTKFWVVLTAYADPPGSNMTNFDLTRRRGVVARYSLIDRGVDPDRVIIRALGEFAADEAGVKGADDKFRKVRVTLHPWVPVADLKFDDVDPDKAGAWGYGETFRDYNTYQYKSSGPGYGR
ncbi:MAG: OmpA family protein [Deltaproteobacteria bacterium]|nr:OmpA family protein [Deltaproteobacteria bacterium]MCB9478091.1 OmpA family protein [Deltaproteobacteria bacterium]MCB9487587.1 OmpA family protein [Deltaproteobacteria bacterium]